MDRPTLWPVSDLESLEFFGYEWANYKTAMGITGGTTSAHLYGCLDEEAKKDLQRSNQVVAAADMTEGRVDVGHQEAGCQAGVQAGPQDQDG